MVVRAELPGSELVEQGLQDLRAGSKTPEAFLVSRFYDRLRTVGVPFDAPPLPDPDRGMYIALERRYSTGAHSVHNSMTRRLLSFLRAAAQAD